MLFQTLEKLSYLFAQQISNIYIYIYWIIVLSLILHTLQLKGEERHPWSGRVSAHTGNTGGTQIYAMGAVECCTWVMLDWRWGMCRN